MKWQRRIAYLLVDNRWALLIAVAIISLVLLWPLRLFNISFNVFADFDEDDPEIAYFHEFYEDFGKAELLVVVVETDAGVFRRDVMEYVAGLTEDLEALTEVREVVSLAQSRGVPVPALAASLAWLDAVLTADLPQNLTQAQRDAFGAHTYVRRDDPDGGSVHTDWLESR